MSQSKIVWFKWHWEDVDGEVPTPECDWWNYEYVQVPIDDDPREVADRRVERLQECNRMCTFHDRKIFYEVIDRPPQHYIDDKLDCWIQVSIDAVKMIEFFRGV